MSFICLRIVDLPDSPAPVFACQFSASEIQDAFHTEKQHLDFVSLHHLVALELVLNLLVPRLPLLVLSAHSATHFGGL
jgi:hypothetical protein